MFVEIAEKGFSDADKLLVCLAIILLLTIIWTILIGIMCKMRTTTVKKTNKFLLEDDEDDDEITVTSTKLAATKSSNKYTAKRRNKTTKKAKTKSASKTTRVVKSGSNQEVYVKVKFYGTTKNLIYVAPERLKSQRFIDFALNTEISMIAVDEAHCISMWGHEFRPGYREIADFIALLPERPVTAAFTATADSRVREDIMNMLRLREPFVYISGFDRPNLFYASLSILEKIRK